MYYKMETRLNKLEGTYDDWLPLEEINLDAEISSEIKRINCDTRDFALGWNFEHPKLYIKANCGFERESNKGLSKLFNLSTKSKDTRDKYTINEKDIIPLAH